MQQSPFNSKLWMFTVVRITMATAFLPPYAVIGAPSPFIVTDYRAPGEQNETAMFQRAVDACATAGGGVVVVPPGIYVVGRVILKSNMTVELGGGAVVRPSTDRADYPAIGIPAESRYRPENGENALNCRYALFYACGAKQVAIEGRGKLLGDGESFWKVKNTGDFTKWNSTAPWFYFTPNAFRPVPIVFEQCENAVVRDITIENTSCYGGWFAGCRYLRFEGVTVLNNHAGPNTDGLHFSSCRNVHITDCDFVCGDDCIAIDPNNNGPSTNFSVTGCTFNTSVNVFRIYTGLDSGLPAELPRGMVTDVSVSNCSVENASGVFNVTADRGDIRRLTFSNFTINMDYRGSAFFLLTRAGGTIADVTLKTMEIRTDGIGTISGENGYIRGITLDGLRYTVCPRTKLHGNGLPDPLPRWGDHHFAPYNLYIRYAKEITLRNIAVTWGEADLADLSFVPGGHPNWSCVECKDVTELIMDGVICAQYGTGVAAVQLTNVKDVPVSRCRAREGTGTFLKALGVAKNIRLDGNDLTLAAKSYEAAAGVLLDQPR